jgi:hypothetical protein
MCTPTLDSLAEWFLRLNGFFTILNFVVHPVEATEGSRQRTDADVLGVRFPNRREIAGDKPLRDHDAFQPLKSTLLVIAEVKAGQCKLNGPWTRRKDENVDHVLRALGCVSSTALRAVAASLYESGWYNSKPIQVRLLCFGARTSGTLPEGVLQFTWDDVFRFIYDRYQTFWRAKRQNQQWPPIGRLLWDRSRDKEREQYVREIRAVFGMPAA